MKISSGNIILDSLLDGGFDNDIITTIYGPAGSGKTNFCMIASVCVVSSGKKVIFIDTEGGFSIERLKQIDPNYRTTISNMVFLKPMSFKEQKIAFDKLRRIINDSVGLIVIDTISMLYRLELGKKGNIYEINRELGQQLNYLMEIARKHNIPVLVTNQVYANFEQKDQVNLVGGDLLRYSSKCLIELQKSVMSNRIAILKKHRSISESKSIKFKIVDKGVLKE